jgi:hypothetical protein
MYGNPASIFTILNDEAAPRDTATMYRIVSSRLRGLEVFLQLIGPQLPEEAQQWVITFFGQQAGGTANVLDAWYQAQQRGAQA